MLKGTPVEIDDIDSTWMISAVACSNDTHDLQGFDRCGKDLH